MGQLFADLIVTIIPMIQKEGDSQVVKVVAKIKCPLPKSFLAYQTSLKPDYSCGINVIYSAVFYWYILNGNTLIYNSNSMLYDSINDELYSILPEEIWSKYLNRSVRIKLTRIISNRELNLKN